MMETQSFEDDALDRNKNIVDQHRQKLKIVSSWRRFIICVFSDLWVRIQALSQNKSCMYLNDFEVVSFFFWNMKFIDSFGFNKT